MKDLENQATDAITVSESLRQCLVCGLLAIDANLRIIAFNPDAEDILQLKISQVLQQPVDVLPAPLPNLIRDTFASGKSSADRRMDVRAGDGRKLQLSANVATLSKAPHEPVDHVVVTLRDFNRVSRTEGQLRRLDRLASIGSFSASMAHEIKNALVPIKTFVQLSMKKDPGSEFSSLVEEELIRVESIVSQMLRFAGPAKPSFSVIPVHEVLKKSATLMQHQLADKSIQLHLSLDAANDRVPADAFQLEQALLNIFINAIEAMQTNGELTVGTQLEPADVATLNAPHLCITVQDTGMGIPPKNMSHLFDTFFTTKPNGTGLGLAITKRILNEHHGLITVDSRINEGTTVTLRLPLE